MKQTIQLLGPLTMEPPSCFNGPRSEAYERWNVIYVSCPFLWGRDAEDFCLRQKGKASGVDDMGNRAIMAT